MPEIVYWSCFDDGTSPHAEQDYAIEEKLEGGEIPRQIEVYGYARVVVDSDALSFDPLEDLLELLDGEYGDPDRSWTEPTEPTEAMKAAELVFTRAVLSEYIPWACECVVTETVDAPAWIREHRPDLMEERVAS